jgi:hypothetical protein
LAARRRDRVHVAVADAALATAAARISSDVRPKLGQPSEIRPFAGQRRL